MALHHPAFLPAPRRSDAASWFTDVLPRILELRQELARHLAGCVSFALVGPGGGEWTVDLGAAQVRAGLDPRSTLLLRAQAGLFERLVEGKSSGAEFFSDPATALDGDPQSLSNLITLLQ